MLIHQQTALITPWNHDQVVGKKVARRVTTADDISDWHQTNPNNPNNPSSINITLIVITILTTLRTQIIIITITTLLNELTLITLKISPGVKLKTLIKIKAVQPHKFDNQ